MVDVGYYAEVAEAGDWDGGDAAFEVGLGCWWFGRETGGCAEEAKSRFL